MGILNATPDSYYDGGNYNNISAAIDYVGQMITDGVSIIDIGGYSSRPGADDVTEVEEIDRVIPIIDEIVNEFPQSILSIDTFRHQVAMAAINAGAHIVNDISAGKDDTKMYETVGKLKVPYIMMHKKGTPKTMQVNPKYDNVITEVNQYFSECIVEATGHAIVDLILDPGFGFGKSLSHNWTLLKNLNAISIFNRPILVGISRKRMINELLQVKAKESLNGTLTANTLAILNGANILRVHDVKPAVELITIMEYYNNNG